MSNLILGRRVKTEEFVPCPDPELAATAPRPILILAGDLDPLVEIEEYRARGVEPALLAPVNHFFSRRRGNQPPDEADLDALCTRALAFLLADE